MTRTTLAGTQIEQFWPDDDDNTIYLPSDSFFSLGEIIRVVSDKWPDITDLNSVRITSEYIHTDCLTYDLYDSSDYTNFIVLSRYAGDI